MINEDDRRKIDDPELNQDSTYDKKAEEDFDDSDDFHKYDDTALDENAQETEESQNATERANSLNADPNEPNTEGQFDGNINI